jgi:hypothetical protein
MDTLALAGRGNAVSSAPSPRWPLERVLFAIAGTMTLVPRRAHRMLPDVRFGHA